MTAPSGLSLLPDVIEPAEEVALLEAIARLDVTWQHPRLRPALGAARRAMACFGWEYVTHGRSRSGGRAEIRVPMPRRSLLVMVGECRWRWRHRVSPVKATRYSLSMRARRLEA